MAPALQPASEAPARQALSIAAHTAVSRNVSARNVGLPPER